MATAWRERRPPNGGELRLRALDAGCYGSEQQRAPALLDQPGARPNWDKQPGKVSFSQI